MSRWFRALKRSENDLPMNLEWSLISRYKEHAILPTPAYQFCRIFSFGFPEVGAWEGGSPLEHRERMLTSWFNMFWSTFNYVMVQICRVWGGISTEATIWAACGGQPKGLEELWTNCSCEQASPTSLLSPSFRRKMQAHNHTFCICMLHTYAA